MSNVALGRLGITIGMVAAAMGAIGTAIGIVRRRPAMVQSSRTDAWTVLAGAITAVVAMERALITRDFSVKYVAEHGSSTTPPLFNVATMWSALEGSILLWVIILSGYLASVAWRFRKRIDDELVGWAMVTLFAIALFFFLLLMGPTNPFVSTTVPPGFDGPGPNPLLQNHPLMAFHPPMLYLGYVGFTVPFAFAVAALVTGRLGEGWLVETRRWTLFAWGFLTAGIILGAWWSYEVLGWGGYWGWDPVEIASFMPWLTGTAFLHSVLVQERRGMLRVWNLALLCSTFALTIYGTFLTRSGVVNSVHAFSEGTVGPMLLGAFGMVVALSIGLIAWRGDLLRGEGRIDRAMSKEGALLANNILFAAFTFVMLLGTTFPLVVEALNRGTLSIGEPYFERMSGPIGLGLLALMAVAPVLPWRNAAPELLSRRLLWPAWSGAAALVIALVLGARGLMPLVAIGLAGFAGGTAVRHLILAVRRHGVSGLFGRSSGGMVVHLGLVVVALAFTVSSAYASNGQFTMSEGDTVELAGHTLTYEGVVQRDLPQGLEYTMAVRIDDQVYEPKVTRFASSGQVIGTPSVKTGLRRDIYLAVSAPPTESEPRITLRVIIQPGVSFLWIGGMVMVIGTAMAAVPEAGRARRRGISTVDDGPAGRAPIEGGPIDDPVDADAEPIGVGAAEPPAP